MYLAFLTQEGSQAANPSMLVDHLIWLSVKRLVTELAKKADDTRLVYRDVTSLIIDWNE